MKHTLSIVAAALLLSACSSFDLSDANKLQKGMSQETVLGIVSKGPQYTYTITVPPTQGKTYSVMVFDLKLVGIRADYMAIFDRDRLLYWGHPYEFNRHPDALINELGAAAVAELQNQ